ncbi:hypothetical protein HNP31_001033 [Acinetobacter johnsonii]|nr:hypothetical protein [Acinetobacter johnsonii]
MLINNQIHISFSLHLISGVVQSLIKMCGLDWTAPNISDKRKKLSLNIVANGVNSILV